MGFSAEPPTFGAPKYTLVNFRSRSQKITVITIQKELGNAILAPGKIFHTTRKSFENSEFSDFSVRNPYVKRNGTAELERAG